MPVLEISIMPIGTDQTSFSNYVSQACRIMEKHGLPYKVTPMATVIEGGLDELIAVAKEIHSMPLNSGVERVITSMTIDERRDKNLSMDTMVQSVQL